MLQDVAHLLQHFGVLVGLGILETEKPDQQNGTTDFASVRMKHLDVFCSMLYADADRTRIVNMAWLAYSLATVLPAQYDGDKTKHDFKIQ